MLSKASTAMGLHQSKGRNRNHETEIDLPSMWACYVVKTTETSSSPNYRADIDKNFSREEMLRLIDYQLPAPSDVLKAVMKNDLDWKEFEKSLVKQLQDLDRKKGQLSKSKKTEEENALAIDNLTSDIKLLQKYWMRVDFAMGFWDGHQISRSKI